ncbi:MAG: hypothetical protein LBB84_12280 [Tannerellaceae bacterium]|jgi:hypothetical protein|nr:hypothetical protein [Tannerellaceae bacterium]
MKDISRKKFLRTAGAVVAGGALAGVSGSLMLRKTGAPGLSPSGNAYSPAEAAFASPYIRVSSFSVREDIQAFDQYDGKLYVAVANAVLAFDYYGKPLHRFPAGEVIRDMAINEEGIYLLYPSGIEVYTREGALLRRWDACSEWSNYCSLALSPSGVFVTDMAHKNLCKYTNEGVFQKFITSPDTFIIPSLSFGITYANGYVYCSNSGRHQVERYTIDGEYAGSFGSPGGAPGLFAGCCNPVHLTASGSEIFTSEKGIPRISCYGSDGTFRSILLNSSLLGGGHAAYHLKVREDRLFVAGKDRVSMFRYDNRQTQASACGGCDVVCPLRNANIHASYY